MSDNQAEQFIASFDKRTGKQLWRTARDIASKNEGETRSGWATPYPWTNDVRTEIVTTGPRTVISYDLQGKELGRFNGTSDWPILSPFAYDGILCRWPAR